jgi:hypothetical protein
MIRFWSEEAQEAPDKRGWRGRVQHVLSGEARSFDDWAMLIELLEMADNDDTEAGVPVGKTKEATQ